ncbi:hypothetical protein PITC_059330 [Penicillium italicum]|uniref:Uncharacterized protein n=1 Tax=Penicillium italicum TaxID=40296 RepID=A0A0A2LPY5_PENIT|nr:hypothetical protein PITC_059330 [Penicillium italicum]
MTNQENVRGNPNPNTNQTPSSNTPAPSPSTSNTPSNQPPAPPSLATRIQTSATSLAKSAFHPSSDLANTLASSTSSKPAGPSSLPNTQTSRDLSTNTTPHGAPGSGSASGSAAQAFREHDAYTSTAGGFALPALTEEEFQRNAHGHDGIGIGDNTESNLLRATSTTNTYTIATDTIANSNSNTIYPHEDLQTPSSAWKGKARAHDPTQHQFETVWQRQWHNPQTPQTTVPPTTDGAAVVSLLSDANFDPNFEDPTTVPDTEIDFAAAPAPLSAAERKMLDSFRRGLGLGEERTEGNGRLTGASLIPDIDTFLSQGLGAGGGIGVGTREGSATATTTGVGSTSTSVSLRDAALRNLPGVDNWAGFQGPDFDAFLSQGLGSGSGNGIGNGEGNATTTTTTTGATSASASTLLRDAVLTNLPGAGDWIGVQERYHDEVWGYLQPVLEEAKAEIEEKGVEVEGLGVGEDGPAVRRLKMILMHMKG